MKLQYASDLHLEFPDNRELLKIKPLKPAGDILLLAGDIVPFMLIPEHSDFFDFISENFGLTYWVPGNHEYYHSDITERSGYLNERMRENVFLVNNTAIQTGNVKLIFSTLWTRISPANQYDLQMRYSDFHVIRNKGLRLGADQYNDQHERCLSFLKEEFEKEKTGKTIVVTHHMPTFRNYPGEFAGNPMGEVFAVELSDLIKTAGPDYWIFGHEHGNKGDFTIGKTRLTSNQMGYVMYNENEGFDDSKVIVL